MSIIFLRCKVHSVRHTYRFNFYLSKIKFKRPKSTMNQPICHFLTLMNNGESFSSLDGMGYSYQCPDQFQYLPGLWQAKRYGISWDLKTPNLFKNNLNNTRNNVRPQIQNRKNGGIGELLITLNKIIWNQGTYFVVTMNNHLKIISVNGFHKTFFS